MNRLRTALFLLLLLHVFTLTAQQERPKIGLVLSGGGAKGMAHIGVLKVLEEQGIRPDYITGTSMGSIIGGLYAIGYTPNELDSIVNSVNWTHLLSDGISLSDVSPEEKNDYNRFLAEFSVTRQGISIPTGVVKGQQISQLLAQLSWHVADIDSFDDYPIPFRAVSADLVTGTQYVFSGGDFTTALRASMSIPTVFAPVVLDSMLLVDGGVLNNFPVHLCQEMGADIIIGVNVGFKDDLKLGDLNSLISILTAASTVGSNLLIKDAVKNTDLLISPDLTPYTSRSYFDAQKIIERGEEAARAKVDELKALMDSFGFVPVYNYPSSSHLKELFISEVKVNGLKNISHRFFFANLGIHPFETVTPHELDEGLKRLMGTRYFENVTYHLSPLSEGYLLNMTVEESPRIKLKFSLHYDNIYKAGMMTNLTLRNVIAKGTRASITADISETPEVTFSLINFWGEKQVTAGRVGFTFEDNNFPIYLPDGSKYGTFKQYYTSVRAGFMSLPGKQWQMDAYLNYNRSTLQNRSGFSEIFYSGVEHFGNNFFSANFDLNYNSLDSRYFPRRGSYLNLSYMLSLDVSSVYKGSSEGWSRVEPLVESTYKKYFSVSADFRKVFSLNSRLTSGVRLAGSFISRTPPFLGLTYIGGLPFNNRGHEVSFIGYSFREKLAEDYALGEINLRYQLMNNVHVSALFNMLVSDINIDEELPITFNREGQVYGYGLILSYNSFMGPLQIGTGSNDSDNRLRWFFNFGFTF